MKYSFTFQACYLTYGQVCVQTNVLRINTQTSLENRSYFFIFIFTCTILELRRHWTIKHISIQIGGVVNSYTKGQKQRSFFYFGQSDHPSSGLGREIPTRLQMEWDRTRGRLASRHLHRKSVGKAPGSFDPSQTRFIKLVQRYILISFPILSVRLLSVSHVSSPKDTRKAK